MEPVLFEIFGLRVYSHGFFLLLGLLACLGVVIYEARRRRWPRDEVIPITLCAFVGGVFGARVAMIFFQGPDVAGIALNIYAFLDLSIGPGSILGALVGAYAGGYLASRALARRCTCDAFAPALALGMAIGRVGDFLSAEDGLGKATTLPWGVPAPGVDYLVHPSPLYEAGFSLVWFGVLMFLRDRQTFADGRLLKVAFGGYAVFRFGVEFVRNNPVLALGLTAQQFASLALFAGVAFALIPHARRVSLPSRT